MNIIKIRIHYGESAFRDILVNDEESLESLHGVISVVFHRDDYGITEYEFYKNQTIISNDKELELRLLNLEIGDEFIYSVDNHNHKITVIGTLEEEPLCDYPVCIDGLGDLNNEEFSKEDTNNRLHFKGKYSMELTLDSLAEILGLPEKLAKRKFEIIEKELRGNLWQESNKYYADIKGFKTLIQSKSMTEYIEVGSFEGNMSH